MYYVQITEEIKKSFYIKKKVDIVWRSFLKLQKVKECKLEDVLSFGSNSCNHCLAVQFICLENKKTLLCCITIMLNLAQVDSTALAILVWTTVMRINKQQLVLVTLAHL